MGLRIRQQLAWTVRLRLQQTSIAPAHHLKLPPEPGNAENTLMPELESSQPADEPRPPSAWAWLKHPWLLLIFGSVMSLGLWVGLGMWIEHQRSLVEKGLSERDGFVLFYHPGRKRFPAWLPEWLGKILPAKKMRIERDRLTGVTITECKDDRDCDLHILSRIGELEDVSLDSDCKVSDETLLELIGTHTLRSLEFSSPRNLTAQHLAALRRSGNLSILRTVRGPFDEQRITELGQMARLTSLSLEGQIESTTKPLAIHWPQLADLDWSWSELTDEQFAGIGAASPLNALHLRHTHLTSRSWPLLERMPLHFLELDSPHVDDALLTSLARIPTLIAIDLPYGAATDVGLQELSKLPQLQSLCLSARRLTIASVRHIRDCQQLRAIMLTNGSNITDEWIAQLAHPHWQRIRICDSEVTDAGVATIRAACPLGSLELPGSRVTDACLPVISQMTGLNYIDLSNTAITDAGLKQAEFRPTIGLVPMLDLSGTRVTREGVKEFIRRNPKVTVKLGRSETIRSAD